MATQIEQLKSQSDDLQQRLCDAIRKESRLRLLIDNQYRLLDPRCKALLDAVRITAANMFASLIDVFRPIYGNYRNDHVMLRNLTRADGFLHASDELIHVRLWLKGRFQKRPLRAFANFLAKMTDQINTDFHRDDAGAPPIRISLVDSSPTL